MSILSDALFYAKLVVLAFAFVTLGTVTCLVLALAIIAAAQQLGPQILATLQGL